MYDLEIKKVIERIKAEKAKNVLIQLPDGLKPQADKIQKMIEKETKAQIFFFAGSCYGACDIPDLPNNLKIDLLIQWGHSEWK